MGFRFQKRIKVLPGITVNLSKSGVSTSIGTRGARVTLGHGKRRTTLGIPGTGISHTEVTSFGETRNPEEPSLKSTPETIAKTGLVMLVYIFVFLIILAILLK